jgi:hypothetical protein
MFNLILSDAGEIKLFNSNLNYILAEESDKNVTNSDLKRLEFGSCDHDEVYYSVRCHSGSLALIWEIKYYPEDIQLDYMIFYLMDIIPSILKIRQYTKDEENLMNLDKWALGISKRVEYLCEELDVTPPFDTLVNMLDDELFLARMKQTVSHWSNIVSPEQYTDDDEQSLYPITNEINWPSPERISDIFNTSMKRKWNDDVKDISATINLHEDVKTLNDEVEKKCEIWKIPLIEERSVRDLARNIKAKGGFKQVSYGKWKKNRKDKVRQVALIQYFATSPDTAKLNIERLTCELKYFALIHNNSFIDPGKKYWLNIYGKIKDKIAIITQYCEAESLAEYIQLDSKEDKSIAMDKETLIFRLNLALQIAYGIQYLHKYVKYVHLDLKAGNVLITKSLYNNEFEVRICDIDQMKAIDNEGNIEEEQSIRTNHCCSPEQYNIINDIKISSKSDVYCFGSLLIELFTEVSPWHDWIYADALLKHGTIKSQLEQKKLPPEIHELKTLNEDIYKLVEQCMSYKPIIRPTFYQIIDRIENICKKMKSEQNV